MSCHRGDAVAKWCECWPGRQAFCILILAPLHTPHSLSSREMVVSVFPICPVTLSGCGSTLPCVLHCPEDVSESCLLLKLYGFFFLYGETCLSLLLLYFLGRSLFHLFCSFDLSLSTSRKGFEVHYFAIHSMRGGRVNLRHVVYSKPGKKHSNCLSALAPSLPLKILDWSEQSWTNART